jgi:chromosomal replication initiator protein
LQLACDVLSELHANEERSITLKDIEEAVTKQCNVSHDNIHSVSKSRNVALYRQLCMYIAKKLTHASYQEIGKYFGNKSLIRKIRD